MIPRFCENEVKIFCSPACWERNLSSSYSQNLGILFQPVPVRSIIHGCTKRTFPGCVNMGWQNCVFPASRRNAKCNFFTQFHTTWEGSFSAALYTSTFGIILSENWVHVLSERSFWFQEHLSVSVSQWPLQQEECWSSPTHWNDLWYCFVNYVSHWSHSE